MFETSSSPHSADWVSASRLPAPGRPQPDNVTDRDTDRHKSHEAPGADAVVSEESNEKGQKREQPEISQDRLWPHQQDTSFAATSATPNAATTTTNDATSIDVIPALSSGQRC